MQLLSLCQSARPDSALPFSVASSGSCVPFSSAGSWRPVPVSLPLAGSNVAVYFTQFVWFSGLVPHAVLSPGVALSQ